MPYLRILYSFHTSSLHLYPAWIVPCYEQTTGNIPTLISVYSNVSRVFLQWFITDSMSMKNPKKTRTLIIAVFLKMFQVKEQWACLDSFCSFCGKMSFFEKDKRWATFHISIWNLNDSQLKHICYVMQFCQIEISTFLKTKIEKLKINNI